MPIWKWKFWNFRTENKQHKWRFGKRFYRRKKNNFWRNISNYHYTKVSCSSQLVYSGANITFSISTNPFIDLLAGLVACPDWKKYAQLFNTVKLRAVRVVANPHGAVGGFIGGTAQLAFLTGSDAVNFGETVESNRSIVLPFNQQKQLYVSFGTGNTGWQTTGNPVFEGKLAAAVSGASSSGQMTWDITIDYYLLFKTEL